MNYMHFQKKNYFFLFKMFILKKSTGRWVFLGRFFILPTLVITAWQGSCTCMLVQVVAKWAGEGNPGNKVLARQLYLYACPGSCQVSRRRRAWCRPWRTGGCRSCSQRSARPASGTPSHPHPARYPHSGPPPAPQQICQAVREWTH